MLFFQIKGFWGFFLFLGSISLAQAYFEDEENLGLQKRFDWKTFWKLKNLPFSKSISDQAHFSKRSLKQNRKIKNISCSADYLSANDLDDKAYYSLCPLPKAYADLIPKGLYDFEPRLPPWQNLLEFQKSTTLESFNFDLLNIINPDLSLKKYFENDSQTILIKNEQASKIEFADLAKNTRSGPKIFRSPEELQLMLAHKGNLEGLRVAIDPGHIGGTWSVFEERHYPVGKAVIKEGDLSFKTALILKKMLEAEKASVFLTRGEGEPGHPYALQSFYEEAKIFIAKVKEQVPLLRQKLLETKKAQPSQAAIYLHNQLLLFYAKRGFIHQTWSYRVEQSHLRNPDMLFFVHFNAGAKNDFGGAQPLLGFVKGDFEAHRLLNPYYRYRAFLDLFRRDVYPATALSHLALSFLSQYFKEPLANMGNWEDKIRLKLELPAWAKLSDQTRYSLGTWAWNLGVMKYVDVPAVLTEGVYMNHASEKFRLLADWNKKDDDANSRYFQYAEALRKAIHRYVAH